MKNLLFIGALSLCVISCERQDHKVTHSTSTTNGHNTNTTSTNGQYTNTKGHSSKDYSPDNTGINVRDSNWDSKTSGDQSEKESDRMISSNLRAALVNDSSLSTNAKNVKIITINGVITLRGPVDSANEGDIIDKKAKSISGVQSVQNLLEIAPKKY